MISENLSINFRLFPLVLFLLVFFIVTFNFLFFKPLLKIIDERKKRVNQMKNDAHSMREEAKELTSRYENEMSQLRKETHKSFEEKKKEIVKLSQKKKQATKALADKMVEEHHQGAASHCEKTKSILIQDVDKLATEVIKTILSSTHSKPHTKETTTVTT